MTKTSVLASAMFATFAAPIACSSSSSTGSTTFAFQGPSCSGNGPSTKNTTECQACAQKNGCTRSYACAATDCKDYYSCFCACQPSDSTCITDCAAKVTSACTPCLDQLHSCLSDTCGSDC